MPTVKSRLHRFLRWSEKYTKTDMVYLAKGGSWLLIGQVISSIFSLALAVAFGHLASTDTYGNYRFVLSLWGICAAISLSGVSTAIIQATARGKDGSLRQGFSINLKWSGGIVVSALSAAVYYYFFQHNAFLGVSLSIVAIFAPFISSFSLFDAFLVGKKDFRRDSIFNILSTAAPTIALIAALLFSSRAIIFILVFFMANALVYAALYLLTLRQATNDETDPNLFHYSAHLSAMGLISAIADKIDSLAIFSLLGPTNLAIYTFAIAIPDQIKQLVKIVIQTALPRFAVRPISEIKITLWKRIAMLAIGLFLALALYEILAPWLFRLFFPLYGQSVAYSRLYAISIMFTVIIAPLTAIFQAHKKTRLLYLVTNSSSVILLLTLPPLTYFYGVTGAIMSQFIYRGTTSIIAVMAFLIFKE